MHRGVFYGHDKCKWCERRFKIDYRGNCPGLSRHTCPLAPSASSIAASLINSAAAPDVIMHIPDPNNHISESDSNAEDDDDVIMGGSDSVEGDFHVYRWDSDSGKSSEGESGSDCDGGGVDEDVILGSGEDAILGSSGEDAILGTSGEDAILGSGEDAIVGGAANVPPPLPVPPPIDDAAAPPIDDAAAPPIDDAETVRNQLLSQLAGEANLPNAIQLIFAYLVTNQLGLSLEGATQILQALRLMEAIDKDFLGFLSGTYRTINDKIKDRVFEGKRHKNAAPDSEEVIIFK